jgi:hypothetical protein
MISGRISGARLCQLNKLGIYYYSVHTFLSRDLKLDTGLEFDYSIGQIRQRNCHVIIKNFNYLLLNCLFFHRRLLRKVRFGFIFLFR